MKVAIVSERFDERGGSERRTSRLVEQLLRCGHEVHVFARFIEPVPGPVFHHVGGLSLGGAVRLLSFARSVRRRLAAGHFDVVHHQIRPYGPGLVTAAGGCHCHYLEQKMSGRSLAARMARRLRPLDAAVCGLERRYYRPGSPVMVVTNSRLSRDTILAHHPLPEDRITVVYNGVDHRRFCPEVRRALRQGARRTLGLKDDEFALLWIGSDFARKGLDRLVEALGLMGPAGGRPLRLLAAGRGRGSRLARRARALGVRLSFLAQRPDVEFYFAAADAFVLPTLFDPFANSSFEAMACGLPVLTTRANGVAELIEDGGSGLLVDSPAEPPALAAKIAQLADDPSLRRELGERAHQATVPHTWEFNARQTLALYERAARRGY